MCVTFMILIRVSEGVWGDQRPTGKGKCLVKGRGSRLKGFVYIYSLHTPESRVCHMLAVMTLGDVGSPDMCFW